MRMTKAHGKKQHKQILLAVLLMCCVAFTTLYSGIAYAASGNNYDTTPPVLEGVTFVQQGQTVSVNDELEVDVQCYDAESDLRYITLTYGYTGSAGNVWRTVSRTYGAEGNDTFCDTFSYDATTNIAKIKFTLGSTWPADNMFLYGVKLVDTRGNVANKYWDEISYNCTVSDYTYVPGETPDADDHKNVYVDAIYSVDKETLSKDGDVAHVTVSMPADVEVPFDENTTISTNMDGYYNSDDGVYHSSEYQTSQNAVELTYDPAKRCFEGDFAWNEGLLNGTHTLASYSLNVWTKDTTYYLYKDAFMQQTVSINVENATNPEVSLTTEKIKNSDVKQDGYYSTGDVIRFSIPAEGREKIFDNVSVSIEPVADAELINDYISLTYNKDTDCYEGEYTISEDTYPCEWRVATINFSNNMNENGYTNNFYVNYNNAAYFDDNYYFCVMQNNTFSAPIGSVSITIRYIDENNRWQEVTVSKDKVASRQMTYADLLEENKQLVDFDAIANKNGYTLEGFRDSYNTMMNPSSADGLVSLDTPIVFDHNNGSYTSRLVAKYEGVEFLAINSQAYLTKNDTYYMTDKGYEPASYYTMTYDYMQKMIAVPDDATMGQVLNNYIESPKAVDGINFTKWTLNTEGNAYQGVTEETKVSDYAKRFNYDVPSLSVIANYDKNVVTINYSYLGQYTGGRYNYVTSVFVEDDATYEDALETFKENALYKSAAHDDKLTVEGIEIRAWNPTYDPATGTYYSKVIDPQTKITDNVTRIIANTIYNKYKVVCSVNDQSDLRYGRSQAFYVTKGETFDLPTTITDYKDIAWNFYNTVDHMGSTSLNGATSIELKGDTTIYGYGTYTGERYPDPIYSPVYSPEVDDEAPTLSMTIGKKTYDSLSSKKDIKYNTYLTNKDKISLTADDNVGISNISYILTSSPVADGSFDTKNQMASTMMGGNAQTYDKPFTINKDGKYVIYAVAMDASYNYTVVSSNGIVVDSTAPKITGVEDGKTYNGETSFAVVDDNLSKVYINGKEVTANNGTYTLAVKDQEKQTIKAMDKAGNETSISVYVNDKPHEHSYVSQIVNDQYLAKAANCTTPAVYYYACSCGAKSDATYTYGEALGHDFSTEYTIDKEATVDEMGYASRHCSRCNETTGGYAIPKLVTIAGTNNVVSTAPQVKNTTTANTTTLPTTDQQTVTEEKPVVKMAEEKIVETVAAIAEAKAGDKVKVEMNGATVVSKEILKEAKEKDVDVVLQMDGYSWTIDAKDIKGMNLEDINLEVNLHADAIPSKQLSKLAGDNPVTQISLTHEGNFGFAATLSFNLGSEYKDKFGNLYWYDSTGKMIFIDSGLIDEDGNVSLTFSHASDYAIVMKDTDDAETIAAADTGSDSAVANINDTGYVASNHTVLWVVVIIVVALVIVGAVTFTRKRRK